MCGRAVTQLRLQKSVLLSAGRSVAGRSRERQEQNPGMTGEGNEAVVPVKGRRLVVLCIDQQRGIGLVGTMRAGGRIHEQYPPTPRPRKAPSTARRPIRTAGSIG